MWRVSFWSEQAALYHSVHMGSTSWWIVFTNIGKETYRSVRKALGLHAQGTLKHKTDNQNGAEENILSVFQVSLWPWTLTSHLVHNVEPLLLLDWNTNKRKSMFCWVFRFMHWKIYRAQSNCDSCKKRCKVSPQKLTKKASLLVLSLLDWNNTRITNQNW